MHQNCRSAETLLHPTGVLCEVGNISLLFVQGRRQVPDRWADTQTRLRLMTFHGTLLQTPQLWLQVPMSTSLDSTLDARGIFYWHSRGPKGRYLTGQHLQIGFHCESSHDRSVSGAVMKAIPHRENDVKTENAASRQHRTLDLTIWRCRGLKCTG